MASNHIDGLTESDIEFFLRYSRALPDNYIITKREVEQMKRENDKFFWQFISFLLLIVMVFGGLVVMGMSNRFRI